MKRRKITRKDVRLVGVQFPGGMLEFTCMINNSLRTFRTDATRLRDAWRAAIDHFNSLKE